MRKIIFSAGIIFFLGCANNQVSTPPAPKISLLKYGISEQSLTKYNNMYVTVINKEDGINILKFDKNYKLISKKILNSPIDITNYKVKDGNIYILGYNSIKEKSEVLVYSLKDNKIIKEMVLGKKYSQPASFFIQNSDIFTAINVYNKKTASDVYIYKNSLLYTKIASPKKENAQFLIPFNGGMLVVGSISYTNDDILIVFIKNKKTVWARRIDLGMDDSPQNITIKNSQIILNAISSDYMGAKTYYTFTIDKNGNIIKSKKNLEFKELPVRFRT